MSIADSVKLHKSAVVSHPDLVNLYGCEIGAETRVGPFVEIQAGVKIGKRCKISSHSFLCEGVVIEDGVFVGHGVMFTNDKFPAALNEDAELKGADDWTLEGVTVKQSASIGSGAILLPGIVIGQGAVVGAGAVVTKDVPAHTVVVGNPARSIRAATNAAK